MKEDQRLIKLLGLKQLKHLVMNGEDGLQKVNFPRNPSPILQLVRIPCCLYAFDLSFNCCSFILLFHVKVLFKVC